MKYILKKESLKNNIQIFAISSLFLIVAVSEVMACSCFRTNRSPVEALNSAGVVFLGEIIEKWKVPGRHPNKFEYTMKIEKAWKGIFEDTTTVGTNGAGPNCGIYEKNIGDRLLIFSGADTGPPTFSGKLKSFFNNTVPYLSACSRTRFVDRAKIDMLMLDAVAAGRSENEIYQMLPDILSNHKDPLFRADAARALAWQSHFPLPKGSVQALLNGLKDPVIEVRSAVTQATTFSRFKNIEKEFGPAIIAAFLAEEKMWKEAKDPTVHEEVLRRLAEAVIKFGDRATKLKTIPHFIRDLKGDDKYDAIRNLMHMRLFLP